MFALVVRFNLTDDDAADRFDALVAELLPQIAEHEPGTLTYAVHRCTTRRARGVFYECYRDRDAFEEHERQPHTAHFLREKDALLADARVEFLTPTGSGT